MSRTSKKKNPWGKKKLLVILHFKFGPKKVDQKVHLFKGTKFSAVPVTKLFQFKAFQPGLATAVTRHIQAHISGEKNILFFFGPRWLFFLALYTYFI